MKEPLASYIRNISDFPREGIQFKDITTLLKDPDAFKAATEALYQAVHGKRIDKVVGIESRGFFFGALLADKLSAGFVPVRKLGRLPGKTRQTTYQLEYGEDTLEIHEDAIRPGERVLLHDDLLATGGTAQASCELIEQLEGNIVHISFLIELSFLGGRQRLAPYPVSSVIKYD